MQPNMNKTVLNRKTFRSANSMTTTCQQKSHHVSEFAHCVFEYMIDCLACSLLRCWSLTVTRWPDGCCECIHWENNGEKSFNSNQIELSYIIEHGEMCLLLLCTSCFICPSRLFFPAMQMSLNNILVM